MTVKNVKKCQNVKKMSKNSKIIVKKLDCQYGVGGVGLGEEEGEKWGGGGREGGGKGGGTKGREVGIGRRR